MVKHKSKYRERLQYKDLFHRYGVDLTSMDFQQCKGTCPFCGDYTFHIGPAKDNPFHGMWDCKSCHRKGNPLQFLQDLYTLSVEHTTPEMLAPLAKLRGLPQDTLADLGITINPLNGEYLIPTWKPGNGITCLFRLTEVDGKLRVVAPNRSAIFKGEGKLQYLFGINLLPENMECCILVEGIWDVATVYTLLRSYRHTDGKFRRVAKNSPLAISNRIGVLGVPGCNQWNDKWLDFIPKSCEVIFAYDNDHTKDDGTTPAFDGMCQAIKRIGTKRKTLAYLWAPPTGNGKAPYDEALPTGYDFNDFYKDTKPGEVINRLLTSAYNPNDFLPRKKGERTEPSTDPVVDLIECQSFDDVLPYFEGLHISPQFRDTFVVMLAAVASTEMEGDQLWVRVLGPPGSGKTQLARALMYHSMYIYNLSMVTGFHSGYKKDSSDNEEDSSLIPLLNNRTLLIKDGDTLMQSKEKARILSELRDLYDKETSAHYRNFKVNSYRTKTSMILCGTNQLRGLNRTSLGERFLDVCIMDETARDAYAEAAQRNLLNDMFGEKGEGHLSKAEEDRGRATAGFIEHLRTVVVPETLAGTRPVSISPQDMERIRKLAEFVSYMRARTHEDEVDTRPEKELHTRLSTQLTKLALCSAIVLQRPAVDADILRLTGKVALDSCSGHPLTITAAILTRGHALSPIHPTRGSSKPNSIKELCSVSDTHARDIIKDMLAFGIIRHTTTINSNNNRPTPAYDLTPRLHHLASEVDRMVSLSDEVAYQQHAHIDEDPTSRRRNPLARVQRRRGKR